MIHDYGYEQAIPYKFIKYKKQDKVEFTEEIKCELDNYYKDIRKLTESNYLIDGKADIKKLSKDLGGKYKSIRTKFIIPFTGKESYSSQELDFLFVCCYELYLKFKLNQTEMNKIWGINGDKLDRLDWYPHRSFSAYHSVCDKTLKPYDTDSLGAKIAKCINQKVQARYASGAFTGITNDLDLFANVSVDKTKCFILTSPLQFSDDDVSSIQRANYALARMLFASGGHLFDTEKYVDTGCIVDKIGEVLEMKIDWDNNMMYEYLRNILNSGNDISQYAIEEMQSDLERYLFRYQFCQETIDIYNYHADTGYFPPNIEYYDEHFGGSKKWANPNDKEVLENKRKNKFQGDNAELMQKHADDALNEQDRLIPLVYECLDAQKLFKSGNEFFREWIAVVRSLANEKFILGIPSDDKKTSDESKYSERFNTEVLVAACYWLSEVFQDERYSYEEVQKYLNSGQLAKYFDAFSYFQQNAKNRSLYMIDEAGGILEELRNIPKFKEKYSKDIKRPQLIYIDTDSHSVTQNDISDLLGLSRIVLVIHDKSGSVEQYGMNKLDKDLNLYIAV